METSLDIGLKIMEPMTVVTNLMVTAFCVYFFIQLKSFQSHPLRKFWSLFFLIFGISTFIGAIAHGLHFYMNEKIFGIVWMIMNISIILSSYFLLLATIEMVKKDNSDRQRILRIAVRSITLIIASITVIMNDFRMIMIYAGVVVLLSIVFNFAAYRRGVRGCGQITFGFALSTISILVHSAKFSLHLYFNYKDISHVIMIFSLYFIFTGVRNRAREAVLL